MISLITVAWHHDMVIWHNKLSRCS